MPNKLTAHSGVENRLNAFPGISSRSSELLFNKRSGYFSDCEILAAPGEVKPHGDVHGDVFVRGHSKYRTVASIGDFVNAKLLLVALILSHDQQGS